MNRIGLLSAILASEQRTACATLLVAATLCIQDIPRLSSLSVFAMVKKAMR